MHRIIPTVAFAAAALSIGCGGDSQRVIELRAALDEAQLSLSDSVAVAETETSGGIGVTAALMVDSDPVFSIGALAGDGFQRVHVDIVNGEVLSIRAAVSSGESCSGSVGLDEAIAAAESAVNGDAVAVEPDDDGHCNREVQVLAGDTLWEVKVGPAGSIVETPEEADDEEGEE